MSDADDIGSKLWGLPTALPRPPRRDKPLEKSIVKSVEDALNELPGVHVARQTVAMVKLDSGQKARVGLPGQGDLVGGFNVFGVDVVLEVEVKRPGEMQRPSQKKRQELVTRRGGFYLVAHNKAEAIAGVNAARAAARERVRQALARGAP